MPPELSLITQSVQVLEIKNYGIVYHHSSGAREKEETAAGESGVGEQWNENAR